LDRILPEDEKGKGKGDRNVARQRAGKEKGRGGRDIIP
jgi:hypothetical protein